MKEEVATYRSYILLFLLVGSLFAGCTEPFSPDLLPQNESILVVEATLSNESKNHEILLSRSSQQQGALLVEENASISIVDDSQQTFSFTESEAGKYVSDIAFGAEPNRTYRLFITTSDGRIYASNPAKLPQTTQIDYVEAKKTVTDGGLGGVTITVDSFDPSGSSTYYRYEYEETYKIIAPLWSPDELRVVSEENMSVGIFERQNEDRTCYATDKSNTIILTKTSGAGEDRVTDFSVRFLNQDNYIISHRYSILVKQYVLSREAYAFYEKLLEFSGSESLFSQSQPGFINGNIFPEDGGKDRVVGFFEVSSVSEKRAFFNYSDLFPEEELPPFVDECRLTEFELGGEPSIFEPVKSKSVSYATHITDPLTGGLLGYVVVPRVCGDCTELGSVIVPDFWEE